MHERVAIQQSVGGGALHTVTWSPPEAVGAVVLVHGLAEHSGRYRPLVERLVGMGLAVHAHDHRGHGRSAGARAQIDRFAWLVADVLARLDAAHAAHPGKPVFLLGHSMGGAVALAAALERPQGIEGLVLSAPAIGASPDVPWLRVALARVLSRLCPGAGVLRLDARLVSRDPDVVAAYESDPGVYRGAVPARTAVELLDAMASFPGRVARLALPTLVLHGTADGLVPIGDVEPVWRRFGTRDLTTHRYEGLYHEVFNEPERERVYDDVLAGLGARLARAGT
jgi:alpha-beta hydrolase superfamily lysophospholipase